MSLTLSIASYTSHIQEYNVLFEKQNLVCQGPRNLIWIIILYAYILITQLIAVVLAFKTRKVEMKILNDAKYIALIIYITTIICLLYTSPSPRDATLSRMPSSA